MKWHSIKSPSPIQDKAGEVYAIAHLTTISSSKLKVIHSHTKNCISFDDPKLTSSSKSTEKFFKEKLCTSKGEKILKLDYNLHYPKIGSGLVIDSMLPADIEKV